MRGLRAALAGLVVWAGTGLASNVGTAEIGLAPPLPDASSLARTDEARATEDAPAPSAAGREAEPAAEQATEPQPALGPAPQPAPQTEPQPVHAPEPQPAPQTEPQPVRAPEPQPTPQTEPQPARASEPQTETGKEPDGGPQVASEPAPPSQELSSQEPSPQIPLPEEPAPPESLPRELRIATWGGAYQQAQERAVIGRFRAQSGLEIRLVRLDASRLGEAIRSSSQLAWDVADLPSGLVREACERGVLSPISSEALEPGSDGSTPDADFLPGALTRCGVASVAWSMVVVMDPAQLRGPLPTTLGDVFAPDLKWKIALPRQPRYLLEMALMADGVPAADVYTTLASESGRLRAFRVLERIRERIVWWPKPREATQLVLGKKAAAALAFNGRAFADITRSASKLVILWDGQVYQSQSWVIARSARNKEAAKAFVALATSPARLAAQARQFPYGPMRRSALAMVGRHPVLGIEMVAFLPTAPENMKNALAFDEAWWAQHGAALREHFDHWLENGMRVLESEHQRPSEGGLDGRPSPG